MSPLDRAWLIGLLEGEGSFTTSSRQSGGRVLTYPRLGLQMTDLDTIERAKALLGAPTIYTVHPERGRPLFMIVLSGRKALALMTDIYPELSARRRAQIDAAMTRFSTTHAVSIKKEATA